MLPPSPATQDPTLQEEHDLIGLPSEKLGHLGLMPEHEHPPVVLSCNDLDAKGLWQADECCSICHDYDDVRPAPRRYRHVTVHVCCHALDALNYLDPPNDDFIDKLFRSGG
jgi:hypothetical protein